MVTVKLLDGRPHEVENIEGADTVLKYFQQKIREFQIKLDDEDLNIALEAAKQCNEALAVWHENEKLLLGVLNIPYIEATRKAAQSFLDFDPST
ncbi:MAG: hypothetical protein ACK519_06410 [Sphingomonadaceae bacterium]|jgi:hypothetical protein